MKLKLTASAIALALSFSATSAELKSFSAGEAAVAADVNANFTAVAMDAAKAQTAAETAQTAAAANATAIETAATANATAIAAAAANATAIETNVDAIAANSATVTANTAGVEANAVALMAMAQAGQVQWQFANEEGEVVATYLAEHEWGTALELAGERAGLVVVTTSGDFNANGNTYVDATDRITTLHQDGEYTNLHYRSEDCTGDGFLQGSWNAMGAEINIAEIQYSLGGGRVLAAKVADEFYSVALDSEMISMNDAPTELMSKMSSNGICAVAAGASYYDYIKAEAEGSLDDITSTASAPGRFGMERPSTWDYTQLNLGNTTIVRK